jgi:lipopolysaccharide biosynthesis regulator YciM
MLVTLLLILILIVITLFCWLSLVNPVDIDFHFFGKTFPADLSTLMISSFVLGVFLVFLGMLARDAKRAFIEFQKSRKERKEQALREELEKGMEAFLRGDLGKARAHYAESLKRDPTQIDLYLRLSEISQREGNEEEALRWVERAGLIDSRNTTLLLREAALRQRMKQFSDAVRLLNRIIDLDAGNLKALKCLREVYLESHKWEDAIRTQKTVLKYTKGKQAEEEETFFYLGLKYEHVRELLTREGGDSLDPLVKEAKEIVREEKKFLPGYLLLGDIYQRMGKWKEAGNVWGKGFRRFQSVIFLTRLEDLYLGRGDPNTLLRIYQRALKFYPDNGVIAFFYAKLCFRLEMLDEALEELDLISLKRKDFPALHRLLAEIYLHKKDFERAVQEFEKTFELSGASYFPFVCAHCQRESREWTAYCPQCHHWSTYTIPERERAASTTSFDFPKQIPFSLK